MPAPDWQSIQDQKEWFDKFKIANQQLGLSGLDLGQFQEFLTSSLYTHLPAVITQQQKQQHYQQIDQLLRFSSEQEELLFRHFDLNGDQILDLDEFALLCTNWLHKIYYRKSALVVVDVQNDFIDGSLALIKSPAEQDGAEVVPVINKLLDEDLFDTVVYTQDWHPTDHIGFHDNLHLRKYTHKSTEPNTAVAANQEIQEDTHSKDDNTDKGAASAIRTNSSLAFSGRLAKFSTKVKVFDRVLFDEGRMEQILWPRHCVQGSWGAELHPKLKKIQNSILILKGTLSHVDAYSAFWDNMRLNETNLRSELISRGVTDVFFCGLAYDYCVAASALDSRKASFMTYVIQDACRGINADSIKKMTSDMIDNDILIVNTATVCSYLSPTRDHGVRVHEEFQLVQARADDDSHKIPIRRDELATEKADSYNMRSSDTRNMIMAVCFKKAFLNVRATSAFG